MASNTEAAATSEHTIDQLNTDHYTQEAPGFDHIPFKHILPDLLRTYLGARPPPLRVLDIGSGPGSLASWVSQETPHSSVECLDPCPRMVEMCRQKGLIAYADRIQSFTPDSPPPCYQGILAISSLIHVPRDALFGSVWQRIAELLVPGGLFITALIIGDHDGVADPTGSGLPRYFTRIRGPQEVVGALADVGLDVVHQQVEQVPAMHSPFFIGVFEKRGGGV